MLKAPLDRLDLRAQLVLKVLSVRLDQQVRRVLRVRLAQQVRKGRKAR